MRHVFIVNPAAGKRDRTGQVLAMAEGLRRSRGLDCACMLTQSPGHATELARKLAGEGGPVRIYACGGDGTVYEVANGIAGLENVAMTCVPLGTGNDFLKNFGPEDTVRFGDPENLWDGPAFPLDLVECNGRYCLTIACTGIDARVAEDVHRFSGTPLLSGRGSYLAAVAANFLFKPIGRHWAVTLDGETAEGEFALVSVCNGRYYGGGSTPVPEARMDDGVLHTILVKKVSRTVFARLFGAYSAGNGRAFSDIVRVSQAREVTIRGLDGDLTTCLDGECFRAPEVRLRLADRRVNFFGPKGCDPNRTAK